MHSHTYQSVLVSVHYMEQVSQLAGWEHSRNLPVFLLQSANQSSSDLRSTFPRRFGLMSCSPENVPYRTLLFDAQISRGTDTVPYRTGYCTVRTYETAATVRYVLVPYRYRSVPFRTKKRTVRYPATGTVRYGTVPEAKCFEKRI